MVVSSLLIFHRYAIGFLPFRSAIVLFWNIIYFTAIGRRRRPPPPPHIGSGRREDTEVFLYPSAIRFLFSTTANIRR